MRGSCWGQRVRAGVGAGMYEQRACGEKNPSLQEVSREGSSFSASMRLATGSVEVVL